ncbi:MAG: hypothetical protein IKQ39_03015 [Oscillospiraceae bacterium]|nr:hypothetical protein [Oscillospiraceae bacterium]
MNKKIVCAALAAMMLCGLTACGGDSSSAAGSSGAASGAESSAAESTSAPAADTAPAASDAPADSSEAAPAGAITYDYVANGMKIVVGEPADDIIANLGTYDKMFEAPSCAYTGTSMYYTYGGLQVVTYPDEHDQSLNRIYEVDLLDGTVATNEGIKVGDTYDDMVAKYGTPTQETTVFAMYKADGKAVEFFFDKNNPDIISEIVYTIIIV